MTAEKTVPEIKSDYGREQSEILHAYGDARDEITATGPESVANSEHMSYGQVEAIMAEKKTAEIGERAREARAALEDAHERYETRLAKRAEAVKSELFGVSEAEDSGALARAALASREELEELMNLGAFTGNRELSRIAFVAAERKGHGDLVNKYLNEIDGDARDLYEEWRAIPTAEQLSRQRENLGRLISVPDRDRLIPRSQVSLYG